MKKLLLSAAVMLLGAGFASAEDEETVSFPNTKVWYQLVNQQDGGIRDNTVLGYYPTTEWYVIGETNDGASKAMGTNQWLCGAEPFNANASDTQKDGQLWRVIANEDGTKYCLVNKAFPDGAISSEILNNAAANNASRWGYVANRSADADNVEWFTLENLNEDPETDPISALTFDNTVDAAYCYLAIAAGGQQYQMMRWNAAEASTQWQFIPVEAYDDDSVMIADIKAEAATEAIFDLQGRRVNAATRGLYIIGGHKVLVK